MEIKGMMITATNKLPTVLNLTDLKDAYIDVAPHITIEIRPSWEKGVVNVHIENRKVVDDRVTKAYNEFMTRMFGKVPEHPNSMYVDKDFYTKEMHRVQERYGLVQGTPDFLEWVLTLVGRSPVITSEGEIVYDTGTKGHPAAEVESVGEAPPSQAK